MTTDAQGNKTPAVFFDGASEFYGEDVAPEGLTGPDPSATIEVWAINDTIADEETLVSWGKRGGPDGTNMSFNYGRNGSYGAVGHWGAPDLGWKNEGGAPEAKQWHHLVYTFDETTQRVYADGVLWNQEDVVLDTHMDPAIAISSQWEADGTTLTGGLKGTLAIGRVRIHDGALSDAQILSNYNAEKAAFFNPRHRNRRRPNRYRRIPCIATASIIPPPTTQRERRLWTRSVDKTVSSWVMARRSRVRRSSWMEAT